MGEITPRENEISLRDYFDSVVKHIDDRFKDVDVKYQIQFTAAEKAIGIASTAQEKLVAQALDGTKEAINKADVATDKRFELLSEKITEVSDKLNLNAGQQGVYVTHVDLTNSLDKLQTNLESTLRPLITFMNNQQGKDTITDPRMDALITQVALLTTVQNTNQGKEKGAGTSWQTMVTIIAVGATLISIFYALAK